eukprot:g6657.t1
MVLIVIVVLIWTFSSYLVKSVYTKFKGPFFLTYFANSLFALYLPVVAVRRKFFMGRNALSAVLGADGNPAVYSTLIEDPISPPPRSSSDGDETTPSAVRPNSPTRTEGPGNSPTWDEVFRSMKNEQIFRASLFVCPLWFLANFLYNESLLLTSVSSSTVLSSMSCVFTALFAWKVGSEKLAWHTIVAVFMTIGGTAMVVLSDSKNGEEAPGDAQPSSFFGDLIALLGAIFYGCYTVAIHNKVKSESFDDLALFLGYLGLIGSVCLLPIVLILNSTEVEPLSDLPLSAVFMIAFKGIFDNVLSDLLWAKAVLLTSPTVSTIGINMTNPLSIIIDWMRGSAPSFVRLTGAIVMVAGFFLVSKTSEAQEGQASGENKEPPAAPEDHTV